MFFFLSCFKWADCGSQQLTATEGEIRTPYYNTEYPNKLACEWIISVNSEQKDLRLKSTAFELEDSVNCTADYVVIRDGKDKTAALIGNDRLKRTSKLFMFNFGLLCLKFFQYPTVIVYQESIVGGPYQSP